MLTLIIAPTGDDSNDGRTLDTPIQTISRAHELVAEVCQDSPQDVALRIGPGEYRGQQTRWRFTMPDHTIRIMPLFNDKVRPRFIGAGGTWFGLDHAQRVGWVESAKPTACGEQTLDAAASGWWVSPSLFIHETWVTLVHDTWVTLSRV